MKHLNIDFERNFTFYLTVTEIPITSHKSFGQHDSKLIEQVSPSNRLDYKCLQNNRKSLRRRVACARFHCPLSDP
jgi:hypothetical protein